MKTRRAFGAALTVLFLGSMASACGPGFNNSFDGHSYDMGRELVGQSKTYRIRVQYGHAIDNMERCKTWTPGHDAAGCTMWPSPYNLTGDDCLIVMPPDSDIGVHELKRCLMGWQYRVSGMFYHPDG